MGNIGVGITTHNRRTVFGRSFAKWRRYLPKDAKLVVVDDCSDVPCPDADYRFDSHVGIARAKNKCLELLDDCDHIFLADDDVYPTCDNWFTPYVKSGYRHLCLSFEYDCNGNKKSNSVYVKEKRSDVWVYNAPNGCMVYLTKECLEKVGGMDPDFGLWGYEHPAYSYRIYNARLIPFPFMDIPDGIKLFHSSDYYNEVKGSLSDNIKAYSARKNVERYIKSKSSNRFIPYK